MYCDSVILKINKLIKKYYDFKNIEKWAKDTSNIIYKFRKNDNEQEKHLQKLLKLEKCFLIL